jgi:hypothetical protein
MGEDLSIGQSEFYGSIKIKPLFRNFHSTANHVFGRGFFIGMTIAIYNLELVSSLDINYNHFVTQI